MKLLAILCLMIFLAGSCAYGAEALLISSFDDECDVQLSGKTEAPNIWRMKGRTTAELCLRRVTQGMRSLLVKFPFTVEALNHGLDRNLSGYDFTGYDFIKLDIFNPVNGILPLCYEITGGQSGKPAESVKLEGVWEVKPAQSTVSLPIPKLTEAGMDLAAVQSISIFMNCPQNAYFMYFDNLRLEKGDPSESGDPQSGPASRGGLQAVRFADAPQIDGRLDDSCWASAARVEEFADIYKGTADAVSQQTTALVGYDDDNLYIACICKESQMDRIRTKADIRDFQVYDDDAIEIFLQPAHRGSGDYLHFEVNSAGVQGDEKFKAGMMNIAWNPDWQTAASRGTDCWTVETAIPFSSLDLTPEAGSTWGFNIARHQASRSELSAIFPTFGGFHVPSRYGDLPGLDVDLSEFCYGLENLSLGKGAVGQNTASMVLVNSTGRAQRVQVELRLAPESGESKTYSRRLEIKPNSSTPVDIRYPLRGRTTQDAQIIVRDAASRAVRYRGTHHSLVPPKPMVVTVTQPNYDNTIFSDQDIKTIRMTVDVNAEPAVLRRGRIEVTLRGEVGEFSRKTVRMRGRESVHIALDAVKCSPGNYTLNVSLLDDAGAVVVAEEQQLRKVGPHIGEARIDENNNLLVEGKPFFPVGMFQVQTPSHLAEMSAAGMNTVQMYAYVDDSLLHYVQAILDECHKNGMRMILQIPQEVVFFWKGKERDDFIRKRVNAFKDHPALLAWYIADEPDTGNPYASPETLKEVRDFIKSIDPYHPVTIAVLFPGRYAEYAKSPDILMGDPYLNWSDDGPKQSMEMMSSSVDAGFAATENKKPFWVIPSVFDISMYSIEMDKQRCPNYREIRCQTYMTVTHGVKGIIYYNLGSHPSDWVPEHVGTWHGFKAVTAELSALAPVILANRAKMPVSVAPEDKEIHFVAKEVDGAFYLMAVNSSRTTKKVTFRVPVIESGSLRVISEGRSIAVTDGSFEDEFARFEVHIYTNAAVIPDLPVTAKIEMTCDELDRKFHEARKSNLAAGDVLVESSSQTRRPTSAIDGIFGSAWADGTRNGFPDWWQIDFQSPKSIRRILLDSEMRDYEIKVWGNGEWRTVTQVTGNMQAKTAHEFADPIITQKVRIYVNAAQRHESTIAEAEFYE